MPQHSRPEAPPLLHVGAPPPPVVTACSKPHSHPTIKTTAVNSASGCLLAPHIRSLTMSCLPVRRPTPAQHDSCATGNPLPTSAIDQLCYQCTTWAMGFARPHVVVRAVSSETTCRCTSAFKAATAWITCRCQHNSAACQSKTLPLQVGGWTMMCCWIY